MAEAQGLRMRNPVHEKFAIMAGCVAFMAALLLFRVDFQSLTPVQKGVLACHLAAAMGVCGVVGGYRWRLGLVVLPLLFLGLTSLTCWWIVSS